MHIQLGFSQSHKYVIKKQKLTYTFVFLKFPWVGTDIVFHKLLTRLLDAYAFVVGPHMVKILHPSLLMTQIDRELWSSKKDKYRKRG